MDELFDALAKDASSKLSRRQVFGRFAAGMGATMMAILGLAPAKNPCAQLCVDCCKNLDFPPRGPEHGKCLSECHKGLGPCGPIVCPDGF